MSYVKQKCWHKGCEKEATKRVIMNLFVNPRQKPFIAEFGFYCNEHAVQLKRSDVFNKNKWQDVLKYFRINNLMPPVQRYCNFEIQSMDLVQ